MIEIIQALEGKKIRLIDVDGEEFEGIVEDYIYPEDNEPEEVAAVDMRVKDSENWISFYKNQIQSIEVLE